VVNFAILIVPLAAIAARAAVFLTFRPAAYNRIFLFVGGCVLSPIILLILEAFIIGVFHNVIGYFGLIGVAGLVIGVTCQQIIEVVMEWRASKILKDPSLVAEYAFVSSQGRSMSVYLVYELTVAIWFKLSGAKVRDLANEFHLDHSILPILAHTGAFDALRGLVGIETAIALTAMWVIRYSYNRFRFQRWRALKAGKLRQAKQASSPFECDLAALQTLLKFWNELLTTLATTCRARLKRSTHA
jgi:hypothetical protein